MNKEVIELKKIKSDEILSLDDTYSFEQTVIKQIVKKDDEYTRQVIKDYVQMHYANKNVRIDFLDEDIVNEIINLGIAEYERRMRSKGEIK